MKWWSIALAGLLMSACAPDYVGPAAKPRHIYSEYGIDYSPYAYGNLSPYDYPRPWGQPDAETAGYLGANRFSPRQGLICERSRNVCYDRDGVDDAETTKYLGSREAWNRLRLYGGGPQIYVPSPYWYWRGYHLRPDMYGPDTYGPNLRRPNIY